jgi:hypothetical protein
MSDQPEQSAIVGTWYLRIEGITLTAWISWDEANGYRGTLLNEVGASEELEQISWNASGCVWKFRRHSQNSWQWVRGTVVAGIFAGRCTPALASTARPASAAYHAHVTGWNSTSLAQEGTSRVYDIVLDTHARACLHLDQDADGQLLGRLKVVATRAGPDADWDADGEGAEFDLEVTHWDGTRLEFQRHGPGETCRYSGHAASNTITGTYTSSILAEPQPWHGCRAEVLSYGLASRSPVARQRWQERTRQQLMQLMMAGNPAPIDVSWRVLRDEVEPLDGVPVAPLSRYDDPAHWPQSYRKRELLFTYTLADPYGPGTIVRESHAWLAMPTRAPTRSEGYRAVLALNGHGSAAQGSGSWAMLDATNSTYWYGDAFARRGFVVLALDIAHRPLEDRAQLYQDRLQGDDPLHGNTPRPALASAVFPHDSDWEEDGERVWDVMRALDLLLSGQLGVLVDSQRIVVTGLSMGGEVATLCGALDPRVSLVIPAAFSPDLRVLHYRKNHPCWRWQHADLLEYTSVSDWHALIAPRPLIIQSGKTDATYSAFQPPFAADKQILRRSRAAYGADAKQLVHYLHNARTGETPHQYRVGDHLSSQPGDAPVGITQPVAHEPLPAAPWSWTWQRDEQTAAPALKGAQTPTLFDYIDHFWL